VYKDFHGLATKFLQCGLQRIPENVARISGKRRSWPKDWGIVRVAAEKMLAASADESRQSPIDDRHHRLRAKRLAPHQRHKT
jgi:hypothetical protein